MVKNQSLLTSHTFEKSLYNSSVELWRKNLQKLKVSEVSTLSSAAGRASNFPGLNYSLIDCQMFCMPVGASCKSSVISIVGESAEVFAKVRGFRVFGKFFRMKVQNMRKGCFSHIDWIFWDQQSNRQLRKFWFFPAIIRRKMLSKSFFPLVLEILCYLTVFSNYLKMQLSFWFQKAFQLTSSSSDCFIGGVKMVLPKVSQKILSGVFNSSCTYSFFRLVFLLFCVYQCEMSKQNQKIPSDSLPCGKLQFFFSGLIAIGARWTENFNKRCFDL